MLIFFFDGILEFGNMLLELMDLALLHLYVRAD